MKSIQAIAQMKLFSEFTFSVLASFIVKMSWVALALYIFLTVWRYYLEVSTDPLQIVR